MIQTEKLYFIGAGSTQYLNMPTTDNQIKLYEDYRKNSNDDLAQFLKDFYSKRELSVNSIYNLLDQAILSNLSLSSLTSNKFYTVEELKKIRRKCNGVILDKFETIIKENGCNNNVEKLVGFYERLAKNGLDKKLSMATKDNITSKDFIYHDYAIINLNWDLYSIMPMMTAHKNINHINDYYISLQSKNKRIKIYNDFSFYVPFVSEEKTTWYSYNDATCSRINDLKNESNKLATIVKTYLPHGSMNLFRCSHCGNQVFKLNKIDMKDSSLYIDNVLCDDKIAECPYCHKNINSLDSETLMQSNFKIKSPYIQRIQEEMKTVIRGAKEIIFLGYSLPTDDIDYRTTLISLIKPNTNIKVVLFNSKYENYNKFEPLGFYSLTKEEKEVPQHFIDVFGKNVLFNFCGVPKVFDNDDIY